jgi:single-strand DNA-binding protein
MSWNNKVELVGSLGAEPEMRFTQGGTAVLSFRMATTKKWTDRAGVKKEEKPQWHSVVAFGTIANDSHPHLHKGSYVRVEGEIVYEEWESDGQKKYATKIHANHIAPAAFPRTHDTTPAAPNNNPIPFGAAPEMAQYGDFQY